MYKDYIYAVLKEYDDKVTSNTISLNLSHLTPGNVKRECKAVCKKHFQKMDEPMLSAIFGYAEDEKGYLQAIQRCGIDKFRPMIYFVEGRNNETDAKNVELLAWLIDFKNRPFDHNGIYGGSNKITEIDEPPVDVHENPNLTNDPKPPPSAITGVGPVPIQQGNSSVNPEKSRLKRRLLVTALIVSLFAGILGFLSLNDPMSRNKISSNESCMYWNDDHYESGQKAQYSKVIALDLDLLNNFKKITIPETITYNSIGKVWYIKIKGEPEFYTGLGYHPIFTQLQLKPITKYIIDKYILKKTLPNDSIVSSLRTANTALGQTNDFKLLTKQLKPPSSGVYGQCQAITKMKTRCLRNAERGGFCWQHKKQGA